MQIKPQPLFRELFAQLDQGSVCTALPLVQAKAASRGLLDWKFSRMPLQPNLREVMVAVTVMVATAAVLLFGMNAVWR
jgi:hypothetical protein